MERLLKGKCVAKTLTAKAAQISTKFLASTGRKPHLAVILVGDDGASRTYVESKQKACEMCGIDSTLIELGESTSEKEVIAKVKELGNTPTVDAILVQLPLPSHIDSPGVIAAIPPEKDADGLTPVNTGLMASDDKSGQFFPQPCTPKGILALLDYYRIRTAGKKVAIVGRSRIVGRPLSIMLSSKERNATVTLCHTATKSLGKVLKAADIIVSAAGCPGLISRDYVKKSTVIIDVGITRVKDPTSPKGYVIKGDADPSAQEKCKAYTPVPGGVGPLTVAGLMLNVALLAQARSKSR